MCSERKPIISISLKEFNGIGNCPAGSIHQYFCLSEKCCLLARQMRAVRYIQDQIFGVGNRFYNLVSYPAMSIPFRYRSTNAAGNPPCGVTMPREAPGRAIFTSSTHAGSVNA